MCIRDSHLAVCGQGEALNSLRYEMLVILREPHVRFQESSVKGNHVARQRRVRRFSRAQFAGGRCRSRWRGMRPGIDAFHAAPVARPSLAALSKNREHKFLNSRSKHVFPTGVSLPYCPQYELFMTKSLNSSPS